MTEAEIAEVERLVHSFADAHRAAERLGDEASTGEVRASIVACDEAYSALMEAVRRLASPPREALREAARFALDRLEEIPIALSGCRDLAHAEQAERTAASGARALRAALASPPAPARDGAALPFPDDAGPRCDACKGRGWIPGDCHPREVCGTCNGTGYPKSWAAEEIARLDAEVARLRASPSPSSAPDPDERLLDADTPDEEVDAVIREAGGDPEAIAERGRVLAAALLAERKMREGIAALAREFDAEADRLPWGDRADAKMNAASRLRALASAPGAAPEGTTVARRRKDWIALAVERQGRFWEARASHEMDDADARPVRARDADPSRAAARAVAASLRRIDKGASRG